MSGFWVKVKKGKEEEVEKHLRELFSDLEFKLNDNGTILIQGEDEGRVAAMKSLFGGVIGVTG